MSVATLSSEFADKLMRARDLRELAHVSDFIARNKEDFGDMIPWLRDIWQSSYDALTKKEVPDEEFYSKEGLTKLKKCGSIK